MTQWNSYKNDFLLFVEAGFIAINQADEDSALKLLRVAEMLNPENTLSQVGFGYLHLHKLELKQAIHKFNQVLEKEPANEMARAFLGIATTMTPNMVDKGEKILMETVKSQDPLIKKLSNTAIDFAEKFVRKTAGPATSRT